MESRPDDALAAHIRKIEHIIELLLCGQSSCASSFWEKGSNGLGVGALSRDRNKLPLRVAQSRKTASEYAARVDVDRPIQPFSFRHWSVPVHNHCLTTIFGGPVVPDG